MIYNRIRMIKKYLCKFFNSSTMKYQELRSVQIEDDEMEISDEEREIHISTSKRARYESNENLKVCKFLYFISF